jgi:hypothetical protein
VAQPDGPGGTIEIARAVTVPDPSLEPLATMHSCKARSEGAAGDDLLTRTVVGTVTAWDVPVESTTVTAVPETAFTSPLTNAKLALPAGGEGRGVGGPWARGLAPKVQAPPTLSISRTVDAVSVPLASFCPVAVMHLPLTTSAKVPVLVLRNVVELAYKTVTSPV